MLALTGVLPVLSTPFTDDDRIDTTALGRQIDHVLAQEADGVTLAMVSEILRLDISERRALAEATVAAVDGRASVITSVGADATALATALTAHAVEIGATAVMANPPLTTTPSDKELLSYYRAIADAADTLPLIVQDASGYVGTPIPLDVLTTLLGEYGPEKIQFKPEADPLGPRLTLLHDLSGGTARVFEGSGGRALIDSYHRGIVGTMPGPDLVPTLVSLWKALRAGDDERAYRLQEALAPLLSLVSSLDSYVAIEKYLLVVQNVIPSARQRGPVSYRLDSDTAREARTLWERLHRTTALTREDTIE